MKISKIFHFLYFAVLSIPLISIPIFAIYSQNHEINDNTLQVQENLKVDFNQKVNYLALPNRTAESIIYTNNNDGSLTANGTSTGYSDYTVKQFQGLGHIWYIRSGNTNNIVETRLTSVGGAYNEYRGYVNVLSSFYLRILPNTSVNNLYLIPQMFDLTQMFGEGNEPTIAEFNTLFPNNYYENTESQEMYIENAYTTTYDDTDIMSQFMYCEYNFMDKYLGMYKYQPFAGIYSWLANTFFGGSAPLVFTIFYQWFAYWLFVSLCWLVFDVLIYVPLLVHKWLDKAAIE